MAEIPAEPVLIASRSLPFVPLPRPRPSAKQWVIYSADRTQAVVLDSDFGFGRRFNFTEQLSDTARAKRSISVNAAGDTAVAIQWPDVLVQIRSRKTHFSTPPGDNGLSSSALVLDDECYFVQPPAASTERHEIDDHMLVKLDFATGAITQIAPIPMHGDYAVVDLNDDLAVVADDGQDGATTALIDRSTGQSTLMTELGVDTVGHNLANGQSIVVAELGIDAVSPDGSWIVCGGDRIVIATWPSWEVEGQWEPADQEQLLYPLILSPNRLAVWELDTTYLTILDPHDVQQPVGRVKFPDGHVIADANEDHLVTVQEQTAYLWSLIPDDEI